MKIIAHRKKPSCNRFLAVWVSLKYVEERNGGLVICYICMLQWVGHNLYTHTNRLLVHMKSIPSTKSRSDTHNGYVRGKWQYSARKISDICTKFRAPKATQAADSKAGDLHICKWSLNGLLQNVWPCSRVPWSDDKATFSLGNMHVFCTRLHGYDCYGCSRVDSREFCRLDHLNHWLLHLSDAI